MAQEAIKLIEEAEAAADEAREKASQEASAIVTEAKERAAQAKKEALTAAKKIVEQTRRSAQENGDTLMGSSADKSREACAELIRSAQGKLDTAIDVVIADIMNK